MKMVKQAFILAAGLGMRMRPITDKIPKPMVEICGKSLILRIIDQLLECGIEKIIINCFYKANMLKEHVTRYIDDNNIDVDLVIVEEEEILETGGGIINALNYLNYSPFFVVNSDSLWHCSTNVFDNLYENWNSKMHSLFLLKRADEAIGYYNDGDFDLNEEEMLVRSECSSIFSYAYAGIHITHPKNFINLEIKKCKLMDIYSSQKSGDIYRDIYGMPYDGLWFHIGTPDAIEKTENKLKSFI